MKCMFQKPRNVLSLFSTVRKTQTAVTIREGEIEVNGLLLKHTVVFLTSLCSSSSPSGTISALHRPDVVDQYTERRSWPALPSYLRRLIVERRQQPPVSCSCPLTTASPTQESSHFRRRRHYNVALVVVRQLPLVVDGGVGSKLPFVGRVVSVELGDDSDGGGLAALGAGADEGRGVPAGPVRQLQASTAR